MPNTDDQTPVIDDFFSPPAETALAERPENQIVFAGSNQNQLMQAAELLSQSNIVPAAYQNKPANCFIAVEFAQRIGCSAMTVVQNLHVIQGSPSWSSKFMISIANTCGKFSKIKYKMTGIKGEDSWGCVAYMTELATGDVLEGVEVTIKMAKDEKWHGKTGSKWQTMPELMLKYRAAAFLIRLEAPELTMGLLAQEEREDMKNVTPVREKSAAEKAWESTTEVME